MKRTKRARSIDEHMLGKGYIRVADAIKASLFSTTHMYRLIKENKIASTAHGKLKFVSITSLSKYLGEDAGDLFQRSLRKRYGDRMDAILEGRLEAAL